MQIEQARHANTIDITYDIGVRDFSVPPISIQPLVENALVHGIRGVPGGWVSLTTRQEKDGSIIIEVQDNGRGFDVNVSEDGTGLRNIRYRLKAKLDAELTVYSRVGEGTKATVTIPAHSELKGNIRL